MQVEIKTFDPRAEVFFEEGCYINELSNSLNDPECSIARARVPVGVQTRWHYLVDTVERYVVLEGMGSVEVGDEQPVLVQAGDVVLIPAGTRQRIRNCGEQDLVFLALCTPRFLVKNYRDDDLA
ncbi:MAG: cupin domain-containing protein [Pseudomonadales bacterium]